MESWFWSSLPIVGGFLCLLAFLIILGGCGNTNPLTFLTPKIGTLFCSGFLLLATSFFRSGKFWLLGVLFTALQPHTSLLLSLVFILGTRYPGTLTGPYLANGTSAWAAFAPPPGTLLWLLMGGSDSRAADPGQSDLTVSSFSIGSILRGLCRNT